MGRTKRIILMTGLFLCAFSAAFIYFFTDSYTDFDLEISDNAVFTSKYNNNLSNCGWIANWAPIDGLKSLKYNSNILDCISPVLYEVSENGSLINISPPNIKEIVTFARNNNIKIYPTITIFDHEIFTKILQNPENFERHISGLLQIVENAVYDGIDLDYESTKYADNDKYKEFIIRLAQEIHSRNKQLIITVLSKWGDDIEYSSLPQTRKVQNWRFLSDYADFIRIMAYDYTYSRSTYPGPIAPLKWVEDVIKYAKTQIPDEKIILGIHLYSYQWTTPAESLLDAKNMPFVFMYEYVTNLSNDDSSNQSFDFGVVSKIISENEGYTFEYQGERVFVYQKINTSTNKYENKVLVYIDQVGILAKKKLASQYNLAGVSYWRLGNELDLIQE